MFLYNVRFVNIGQFNEKITVKKTDFFIHVLLVVQYFRSFIHFYTVIIKWASFPGHAVPQRYFRITIQYHDISKSERDIFI